MKLATPDMRAADPDLLFIFLKNTPHEYSPSLAAPSAHLAPVYMYISLFFFYNKNDLCQDDCSEFLLKGCS